MDLFALLPLERAMPELLPRRGCPDPDLLNWVQQFEGEPVLKAGLWLYINELDRAHALAQDLPSQVGSLWHAILHRREGDFSNAKYWYRQAGGHVLEGFDPYAFVDAVATQADANPSHLVERQRAEWEAVWREARRIATTDDVQIL